MSAPANAALRRKRVTGIAIAIGIGVAVAALTRFGGGAHWREKINNLPAIALIISFAVVPLTGFPTTILLLAVGARFGFWPGLGIAAGVIALHLTASYPIAGLVRKPVTSLLGKAGWQLPKLDRNSAWPFATFIALAPGLSYALKNYMTPLTGVPFSIYFFTHYPVHLATSVLGLMLGGAAMHFSWPVAAGVAVYAVVMITLTKSIAHRLKSKSSFDLGSGTAA